ncbi:MAG: hypothetical protein EBQ97_06890 [Bacteroidetes bacterium]|nr:hypothetical protein [Bacteroidota bacterium]
MIVIVLAYYCIFTNLIINRTISKITFCIYHKKINKKPENSIDIKKDTNWRYFVAQINCNFGLGFQ